MKIEIVEERKNPYLDRVETILRIEHPASATPSREDISRFIVDRLGYEPGKVIIKYIKTFTGMNISEALIYYYPDGIDWSTIEPVKRGKVIRIGEEESKAEEEEA